MTEHRRLDPVQRFGLRLTLFALALLLVAVPFSALLFQVLAKGPLTRADGRVAVVLNRWVERNPWSVGPLKALTWMGRPPVLALFVVAAAVYVVRRHRRRLLVFLVVTPLGGGLVDSAVKILVNRPRPVVDHPVATAMGKSFPSGHAMSSTITYGVLLLVFLPLLRPVLRRVAVVGVVVLVLAIGASRLFLGVHFVTDVLGGFVLGLAWLIGAVAVFQTWRVEEGRPRVDPLEEGVEPEVAEAPR